MADFHYQRILKVIPCEIYKYTCSLIIISGIIKPGSVAILCITNLFAQGALQRILCWQCYFAFQTPLDF